MKSSKIRKIFEAIIKDETGEDMTLRDVIQYCSHRKGKFAMDVQPLNHLDKLFKHLNGDGKITMEMCGCQHPFKINKYCSSQCPLLMEGIYGT